jgi:hypothetical protein
MMPRGIWLPTTYGREYRTVYFDGSVIYSDAEDYAIRRNYWYCWEDTVLNCLPDTFYHSGRPGEGRDGGWALAENGLFEVIVSDECEYTALAVAVKEGAPAFAASQLDTTADKIFRALHALYPEGMFVRASWLHGVKYQPSKQAA